VYRREERYCQTISAILGAYALVGLVLLLPLQLLVDFGPAKPPTEAGLVLGLGFAFILILVAGRIVQLATDSNLFTGACVMAVYVFVDVVAARLVTSGT
jgi:formate/nitrite transporter FocA (FNT family)